MPLQAQSSGSAGGFFRNGWQELKRKLERRKLKKQMLQLDSQRTTALGQVGRNAWKERIDLSSFPEFREQLERLASRAGDLSATAMRLGEEKAALESRRQAEAAKFDGQRQAVEAKKRPTDAALQSAKTRLSEQDHTIKRLETRRAALPGELAALEQQIASLEAGAAPDKSSQLTVAQNQKWQLELEQRQTAEQLPLAQQALPSLAAELQRLYDAAQAYAAELNGIEAERKDVLSPIAADLERVQHELGAASQEVGSIQKEQQERFVQLGKALYESRVRIPEIAPSIGQVVALDRNRAVTQAALDTSLNLTHALPKRTMLKFASAFVLTPLLFVGIGVGGYEGWQWWAERHEGEEPRVEVNPYLSHPLATHPAYLLAHQLAQARSEQETQKLLLDAFRAIHLGVYTANGKKILGGAERSDKDFYLYDFLWKALAHGYFSHTVNTWDGTGQMFGQNLLHLKDPTLFQSVFAQAVQARYEKASKAPSDPQSYVILLVDGLARQQLRPYSLADVATRSPKDLSVDRVQSFLLMLDFFSAPRKPAATKTSRLFAFPSLIETVYAQEGGDPCGSVQGEQDGEGFSEGLSFLSERLEQAADAVAGAAGKEAVQELAEGIATVAGGVSSSMDLNSAFSVMTMLAGVTVEVHAKPVSIHLPHEGEHPNKILFTAQVTADAEDFPPEPIPCGPLKGDNLVPGGRKALNKVRVEWDWPNDFEQYYKWTDETKMTGRYATFTDESGMTQIEWISRKSCPGKGKVVGPDYVMQATAVSIVDPAFEALIGGSNPISQILKAGPSIYQFVAPETRGYTRYEVRWHEPKPKQKQY